jgi:hypothetical protein
MGKTPSRLATFTAQQCPSKSILVTEETTQTNEIHIMKKPKIKSSQQITLHRDRTVSFFSILTSSWMRVPAIDIEAI